MDNVSNVLDENEEEPMTISQNEESSDCQITKTIFAPTELNTKGNAES